MIPPNLCVPMETHSMWYFFNVTLGRYYQYLFGLKRKQIDLCLFDQQLCSVISHRDSFYGNEWDQSRLWSQGYFWRNRLCEYVDRYSPFMYQWVEENCVWLESFKMTNIPIKNFANKLNIAQKRMWIDEKLCLSGLDIAIFPRACFQKYTYPSVRPGRWKEEGVFWLSIYPSQPSLGHQEKLYQNTAIASGLPQLFWQCVLRTPVHCTALLKVQKCLFLFEITMTKTGQEPDK